MKSPNHIDREIKNGKVDNNICKLEEKDKNSKL